MQFKKLYLLTYLFLGSFLAAAQGSYDIEKVEMSENFNEKGGLISRKISTRGTQNNNSLKVVLVLDPKNKVQTLSINDEDIKPLFFKEYRILTDFLIEYAAQESSRPTEKAHKQVSVRIVSDNAENNRILEGEDKIQVVAAFTEELQKDQLLTDAVIFDLMITSTALYINGRQQSEAAFLKYKALYEKLCAVSLSPTTYFQLMQTL